MDHRKRRTFYEKVLQEITRDNGFSEPRLEFEAGCKKGVNFIAELLRCTVTDQNDSSKKLYLMVKLAPENEVQRTRFRVDECFKTEANMYRNVLPTLADFLKGKSLLGKGVFPCTARAYAVHADEDMIVVMEDLRNRGFTMSDPKVGLDLQHCRLVLKQLARLHAASLALQKENPELHEELADQLKETLFAGQVPPSFTKAMQISRCLIEERFPKGTTERQKFEKYVESSSEILVNSVKRNPSFCCITHGDLWVNNILFKYKLGSTEPEQVCFVDLQLSRMASPILDLSYFFCLCTRKETRKSFHALIKTYHDSLSTSLFAMGHDPNLIIPWDLFEEQLRKYFGFGWGSVVKILPYALLDEQAIRVFEEEFVKDKQVDGTFVLPQNSDYLKTVLSDLLEDLVKLGFM